VHGLGLAGKWLKRCVAQPRRLKSQRPEVRRVREHLSHEIAGGLMTFQQQPQLAGRLLL